MRNASPTLHFYRLLLLLLLISKGGTLFALWRSLLESGFYSTFLLLCDLTLSRNPASPKRNSMASPPVNKKKRHRPSRPATYGRSSHSSSTSFKVFRDAVRDSNEIKSKKKGLFPLTFDICDARKGGMLANSECLFVAQSSCSVARFFSPAVTYNG